MSIGPHLVVLFALDREAEPFRRIALGLSDVQIAVSGIGKTGARDAAERLAAASPGLVIAAGFCGALEAGLKVGDVVQPTEVVDPAGKVWPCVRYGEQKGRLLTADRLIASSCDKLELGLRHNAGAVDMESAVIAEVCARHGIPFMAIRAVSDPVETELSPQLVRLLSGGRVSVWRACRALVGSPRLLGEFRRLARDTRVAGRRLAAELQAAVTGWKAGPGYSHTQEGHPQTFGSEP